MTQADTQQEVITVESSPPKQVVKTTTQAAPVAKGDPPQKVFEKKKTIVRFNQVIWYILGLIEVLLGFRIALKVVGANPLSGFTDFIYMITDPLAAPFRGILGVSTTGNSLIEWSTIVAAIVYLCVAWGLIYFLNLIYPITPKDIDPQS